MDKCGGLMFFWLHGLRFDKVNNYSPSASYLCKPAGYTFEQVGRDTS